MPNINITVVGKIATNTTPGVVIVCGNSDYTITFDLDGEWAAENAKTARFVYYKNGQRLFKDVPFTGDTAAVPALSDIDFVMVGVYAGDLRTTTPAQVLCDRSILCGPAVEQISAAEKAALQAQIGDLEALQTTNKSNLVGAVNELKEITGEHVGNAVNDYLDTNPVIAATFEKHSGNLWDGVAYQPVGVGESVFTPYMQHTFRWVVFKAKPNTEYIITVTNMASVGAFGQADASGVCTQIPVFYGGTDSPVTALHTGSYKLGGFGKYVHFKTNDNFFDDSVYLIWESWPSSIEADVAIFEGSDVSDYENIGEYSPKNGGITSPDLLLDEKNLSLGVNEKLRRGGTSVQPEDFKTVPYGTATLSRSDIYSYPELRSFSIGNVQKMFNTARICQADANRLMLVDKYNHCPTMVIVGDRAYITTFQNTVNNVDTLELSTIELYVVDLQGWEVVENINVAKPGLACGNDTLKYGGLDANILNIDNTTLRITFTTQLSDGVHRLCYRDYTVSNGTLGPVGLCKISDGNNTHDFDVEGVKAVCGDFSVANPIMNMATQYATYNGEHYIGLGVDNVYPNIPILKTTDFITFTHWATPTVEGNHAQYECACKVVKQSNGVHLLYTATRQTYKDNPEKMLIMAVSLDDGSVVRSTWIPDQRARPFWYYAESLGSAYLFHILNDQRATSTITQIGANTFAASSIGSVADMFGMIYPSVADYGEYMVVAYMRAYRAYIAKLPKLPIYTHNQVIPMINKFLDYFDTV